MRPSLLFVACLSLAGCIAPASVTLVSGAHADISAADLALPTSLRDDSMMPARLAMVPCGPTAPMPMCPVLTGVDVTLECTAANVCDPMPVTIEAPVGDVVDIDMASGDLRGVLSVIDSIDITSMHVMITNETLTFAVAPIDVYWASEGATTADLANHLATIPAIPVGTPAMTGLDADIDMTGSAAMGNYLAHTSHRIRLFARTVVDMAPGDLFPDGALGVDVSVTLVAKGKIAG